MTEKNSCFLHKNQPKLLIKRKEGDFSLVSTWDEGNKIILLYEIWCLELNISVQPIATMFEEKNQQEKTLVFLHNNQPKLLVKSQKKQFSLDSRRAEEDKTFLFYEIWLSKLQTPRQPRATMLPWAKSSQKKSCISS